MIAFCGLNCEKCAMSKGYETCATSLEMETCKTLGQVTATCPDAVNNLKG